MTEQPLENIDREVTGERPIPGDASLDTAKAEAETAHENGAQEVTAAKTEAAEKEAKAAERERQKAARKEARAREKELIRKSRVFATENAARSWGEVFITYAVLAGFLTAAVLLEPWWARAIASIFAGLTVVRGFILFHDHMHHALLRNSTFARSMFWLYGVLVLTPPKVWRQTHDYHHAHNSKIVGSHVGSFPILTVEMYEAASPREKAMYRFMRSPLNILLGYFTVFGFGMCVSPFLRRPKGNWDSAFALVLHVALVVTLTMLFGFQLAFFVLVLPLMVACAAGGYLFYAQHNFEEMLVQPRHTWSFSTAALECSSYMELGPIMRWFTGNIGYHHVHHLNPTIPFYRLPEAMAAIPELQNPGKTTLWPSDIMKCFSCNLWDEKKQAMVGYP